MEIQGSGDTEQARTYLETQVKADLLDEPDGSIPSVISRKYTSLKREFDAGAARPFPGLWSDAMLRTVERAALDVLTNPKVLGVRSKQGFDTMAEYGNALVSQIQLMMGSSNTGGDDDDDEGASMRERRLSHLDYVMGRITFLYYGWTYIKGDMEFIPALPLLTATPMRMVREQCSLYERGWERVSARTLLRGLRAPLYVCLLFFYSLRGCSSRSCIIGPSVGPAAPAPARA